MPEFLKKIEPKWLVLIYGAYIVGRAIQALLDPNFAWISVSGGHYQWEVSIFKFSYLSLTFLHPIIFAIVSVEVAKMAFPKSLFLFIVGAHVVAFEIVGISLAIEWSHAFSQIGADTFASVSSDAGGGEAIVESQELLKGLALAIAMPMLLLACLYWWNKPVVLFNKREQLGKYKDAA